MKIKKLIVMLLSMILVLSLVPATVFAEAAEEPEEPEEFEIYGWYDYGEEDVVTSVKLDGEELSGFSSGIESYFFAPEAKLSVEVTLEEGYELGILEDGYYFFWMIGEAEDFIPAGKTVSEVTVPDAEYLEENTVITLCMRSVSSEVPEEISIIESVTINAPKIKVGDGYTMVEHTYTYDDDHSQTYYEAEPQPEVTVPEGEPYALEWYEDENGARHDYAFWIIKDEDGNYYSPDEDVVFEYNTDYYIELYLYATDIEVMLDDDPERATNDETFRLFCLNRPPEIIVNNGELVDYEIEFMGVRGEEMRMGYEDFSPYMWVVIKVNIPEPSPETSDMNPNPWVWTMVLAISVVLTVAYYEIEDIRKAYKRQY